MDEPDPSMHATPFTGIMIVPSTDRTVWDTCSPGRLFMAPSCASLSTLPPGHKSTKCTRMHYRRESSPGSSAWHSFIRLWIVHGKCVIHCAVH